MHARARSRRARSCAPFFAPVWPLRRHQPLASDLPFILLRRFAPTFSTALSRRFAPTFSTASSRRFAPTFNEVEATPSEIKLDFARGRVHLHRLFARTFPRSSVSAGALTPHRQALTMTDAAIAAQIHQTLDVHRHFATQVALDRELGHLRPERGHFGIGQVLHLDAVLHAGGIAYARRPTVADAKNVG